MIVTCIIILTMTECAIGKDIDLYVALTKRFQKLTYVLQMMAQELHDMLDAPDDGNVWFPDCVKRMEIEIDKVKFILEMLRHAGYTIHDKRYIALHNLIRDFEIIAAIDADPTDLNLSLVRNFIIKLMEVKRILNLNKIHKPNVPPSLVNKICQWMKNTFFLWIKNNG
uniref:Uncharacterized protein n=1 Tax=Clastoptera arizonana TaxID=38151 RepID=A0A1B6DX69_9HEMI